MVRGSTISVSFTPDELRLVREGVKKGRYPSESDLIRDTLRRVLSQEDAPPIASVKSRAQVQRLAAAYRAT